MIKLMLTCRRGIYGSKEQGIAPYLANQLPVKDLTHAIYAFANLTEDGNV